MEQCTIYSHSIDFDAIIPIIKKYLPKATLERKDTEGEKILIVQAKKGLLSRKHIVTIQGRQRTVPSYQLEQPTCPLTQNLVGMHNYVSTLPAQNTTIQSLLLQKIATLNSEISFTAQPYISEDFEKILKETLQVLDGILFTPPTALFSKSKHQQFLDKNFDLILDTAGVSKISQLEVNIDTQYYDPPQAEYTSAQLDRKARSEALLQKHQVTINPHLACTPNLTEIELRDKTAIINRIYALTIITARAEGVAIEQLKTIMSEKEITELSPYENYVLSNDVPTDELSILTWRYESLFLLCWAIQKIENLPYPSEMCVVDEFLGSILQQSREEFTASSTLRSKEEIVEALDLTYRMNWACVDARIKKMPPSGKLHPGIVYERHYALNWLVHHRQQNWDAVTTDT